MADHDGEGAEDLENVSDPVGGEVSAPVAIVPEGGGAPSGGMRPRWLLPLVVAVVVVVVVVAGLVGWRVVENRRHGAALGSCSRAVKTLQDKTGSDRLAQYREAAGIKADQVKDASTVVAMARSVKDAEGIKEPTVRCKASMSTGDLNEAADQARKIDGRYAAVARAAKAVLASRDAKALDDARTALDGKKGEASRLLADSDGKVADNATRDGLQQAIDQAGQAKGDQANACRDAVGALQAAIDRVNASMQATRARPTSRPQHKQRRPHSSRRRSSRRNGRAPPDTGRPPPTVGGEVPRNPAGPPTGRQATGAADPHRRRRYRQHHKATDLIGATDLKGILQAAMVVIRLACVSLDD